MTTRYMDHFFAPGSIAVVGASERHPSLGGTVLENLIDSGFQGELMAVNRRGGKQVLGVPCHASAAALPVVPDLAILCTGPATIPALVDELGRRGVRAVLIVMGRLSLPAPPAGGALGTAMGSAMELAGSLLGLRLDSGKTLKEATWEAARPHDLRIMGPNCIGVLVPHHRLNASYAHCMAPGGDVAYVGQSGMLGLSVLDWASGRGLGLSHLTTVGDSLDVDVSDVVEYLAEDSRTRAILLHVERVSSGRRFVSALRAAARNKLVVVLRSPRVQVPGSSPAPGLPDPDLAYDAALERAGVLRVGRMEQLFNALETATRMGPLGGERLAVVCNGMGPAMLARDHLLAAGGCLAALSPECVEALRAVLPRTWVPGNPVDIDADASPERLLRSVQTLLADAGVDAVLVIHVPTLIATPLEVAATVIPAARAGGKPVLTCWMGRGSVQPARDAFDEAGIATFGTPEEAVDAFMHQVRYRRHQDRLSQTPAASRPADLEPAKVWATVGDARNAGRDLLSDQECLRVLKASGIPAVPAAHAADAHELGKRAGDLAPPWDVKVLHRRTATPFSPSRGIAHGVVSPDALAAAADALAQEVATAGGTLPGPRFRLQPGNSGLPAPLLGAGIVRDPVFGPLVYFGSGGGGGRARSDRRVGLPPLNLPLARLLVDGSDAARELDDHSADPERDRELLAAILVRLSRLVEEVPAVAAVELDPLLPDGEGVRVRDARIALGEPAETAIAPYPGELEEHASLARSGRAVLLRPIRGEDAPAHAAFVGRLSPETIRYRFFQPRSSFTRRELAQATQIDYAREMAFIATATGDDGAPETLGVVRAWTDPDNVSAEFAVIVDDALRREGLGRMLLEKMINYARRRGVLALTGSVLPDNEPMLGLARNLGFDARYSREEGVTRVRLKLNEPTDAWQRERLAGG